MRKALYVGFWVFFTFQLLPVSLFSQISPGPATRTFRPPGDQRVMKLAPPPAAAETRKSSLTVKSAPAEKFTTPDNAVQTFFVALHVKNYAFAWKSMTRFSQNQFVERFSRSQRISEARARESFEKNDEEVRLGFWNKFREDSKIVSLVPLAVYVVSEINGDQATVQMTSGGIAHLIKALREGGSWRVAYSETFPVKE